MGLIFLEPVFKEMVWGGNHLRSEFGYQIPSDQTGECWAISAHQNGDCKIKNGQWQGKTLSWLWENEREVFGRMEGDVYPLLVKIIDAKTDLSIQVHPDDNYARLHENGSLGKTECWYILDCEADAKIVIGHNAMSHQELRQMIDEQRWSDLIRQIPVKKGDFFQINPGCVHAIKGGTMILETQQNSDITYRVYDYDRNYNGRPRELHIEKSLDVIQVPFKPVEVEQNKTDDCGYRCEKLVTCEYYTVWKYEVNGKSTFEMNDSFMNISIIDGTATIDGIPIQKGDHFIIPFGYGNYTIKGDCAFIASTRR